MNNNYTDSRTKEEREVEDKITSVTDTGQETFDKWYPRMWHIIGFIYFLFCLRVIFGSPFIG